MIFLTLGVLLLGARLLGEIAKRFHQPAVLGELLAGLLLGPTVLGYLHPGLENQLFPVSGGQAVILDGFNALAVVLFMLVVGMEVDLPAMLRRGGTALVVSLGGIIVPFGLGLAAAMILPGWFAIPANVAPWLFALFFATAMAISALPVIAKTLMDLNLFRSDLGMVVISAAIFNDFVGWIFFAVILGLMGVQHAQSGQAISEDDLGKVVLLTLCFVVGMLTVGRWLLHRLLPWIQAHLSWPGGVLGFTLALALFGAFVTERIGLHAIFGAFLVGVAIGDSPHLRERTRAVIEQFTSFFFAPVFFASLGLKVDFFSQFDAPLVGLVLTIACAGKIIGCGLGARLGGMVPREATAVGLAMNSRGVMEIVVGMIALQAGLIGKPVFVALMVTALVTSLMAGPLIQRVLRRKRARHITDYLQARTFVLSLKAAGRDDAIRELVALAAPPTGVAVEAITAAVLAREASMSTGIGNQLAVPHARLPGLAAPVVAVGLSNAGIPFEAPDGEACRIVVLILTAEGDNGDQLELLADVARIFKAPEHRIQAGMVKSFTEFLALVKSLHGGDGAVGH